MNNSGDLSFFAIIGIIALLEWIILAICIPFFIFRIRNEVIKTNKMLLKIIDHILLFKPPEPENIVLGISEHIEKNIVGTFIHEYPSEALRTIGEIKKDDHIIYGKTKEEWSKVIIMRGNEKIEGWIKR